MNKTQAQSLIGQRVDVWTAANGVYVGTLNEVLSTPGRPWRAKVLIDGVLEPAQHFERGGFCRRGFRPGETLEAGASSIKPSTQAGTDYRTALVRSLEKFRQFASRPSAGDPSSFAWATEGTIEALSAAIVSEDARLAGGAWILQRPAPKPSIGISPSPR